MQPAKAAAVLAGRSLATPDDIRALAVPVLAHRLILSEEVAGDMAARVEVVQTALARVGYRKAVRSV